MIRGPLEPPCLVLRFASEVEISPTFLNPTESGRSVVNCMNHSPFEWRVSGESPTNGVEVGGEVATQRTSSGAPTLVEQKVQTGGDGLVLGLSVTSSPGRMMTTNDRVPVAKMGLAEPGGGEGVPESAGLGRKQLGLPGRTGDLACGPGSVDLKAAGLGRKQLGLPGRTGDLTCGLGSVVLNQPTPGVT